MRLTNYTDFSLRVLIYLATIPSDSLVTIREIADAYDISKNHLMKVIYELGKLGYIETIRGRNGGFRLLKKPEEINIGLLVRETEEDFNLVECFGQEQDICIISPACQLKGVFKKALSAYLQVLDQYTLADLVHNSSELWSLLSSTEE